jgi:hypothetical protein
MHRRCKKSAHSDQRDEYDLLAQKQMVIWAFAVALGALVSIPLTAAGIVFVWANLTEMRAQRAQMIAQTNVSIDALEIARRDNQLNSRQLRYSVKPALEVTLIDYRVSGGESDADDVLRQFADGIEPPRPVQFKGAIQIKNASQHEARIVGCFYGLLIGENFSPTQGAEGYDILKPGESCYPTAFRGFDRRMILADDKFGRVFITDSMSRSNLIRNPPPLVGIVEYESSLGDKWELGFAFERKLVGDERGHHTSPWGGGKYNFDKEKTA